MKINKEYGDYNSIVEFTEEEHDTIKQMVISKENEHGYDTTKWRESYNSFDNDDYLFASYLIYDILDSFTRAHFNPIDGVWREGYKKPPYIRVKLTEQHSFKLSEEGLGYVIDDKGLNMGINGPDERGTYTLVIHRYFFLRFIQFLGEIFDDNKAIVIKPLEEDAKKPSWEAERRVTRDEISDIGKECISKGYDAIGRWYQEKAKSIGDDSSVSMPFPVFRSCGEEDIAKFIGIAEHSIEGIVMALKKRIYNTSGFAKHFDTRNDLISDLFINSFRAVFFHEFAHVVNGHALLEKKDASYANQREIRICAEQNADDTALRMFLAELLYDGLDGNPHNYTLVHSYEELKDQWALRIFSFYLILSWAFRKEDRIWERGVLEAYRANANQRHPLYQFRLYNVMRRAALLLPAIVERKDCSDFRTCDGRPIDIEMVIETLQLAKDYINSFESSFEESLGDDQRNISQMLADSIKVEYASFQSNLSKIPYAPPMFDEAARAEVETIRQKWPELKKRLEEVGTFATLYDTI